MGDEPPEPIFPRLGGIADDLSELDEEEIVPPEEAIGLTPFDPGAVRHAADSQRASAGGP